MVKDAAGVHHGAVKKQSEQLIAQIVMCFDVATAAFQGIAPQVTLQEREWFHQPFRPGSELAEGLAVAQEQFDHGGQVIALPVTFHVGFATPERALQQDPCVKRRVCHRHGDRLRKNSVAPPEHVLFVGISQHQFAVTQMLQARQQNPFGIVTETNRLAVVRERACRNTIRRISWFPHRARCLLFVGM